MRASSISVLCVGAYWLFCQQASLSTLWENGTGFRSARLETQDSSQVGFTLLSPMTTGIHFTNRLSEAKAAENQIRLNGSGLALGDIDGDGWCDLYLCRLEGPNALYRNLGRWKFEEIAASAGVACPEQFSTGAAFADMDGDNDLDLLVNGIGTGTRLFLNDGQGRFSEAVNSRLARKLGATTLTLADIDGDGDLDLYCANYRTTTIRTTGFVVMNVGGKRMIRPEDRDRLEYTAEGRVLEHGEPDFIYRNDGAGRYTPLSWTDGTFLDEDGKPLAKPPLDWGLTATFRDLNGDGAPDLYVCNDFHSTDRIWINDGKGGFRAIPRLALRKTSTFSMAVDFGDLNRDGFDDIFVADMLSLRHSRRLMQLAATDHYRPVVGLFDDRPQFDRNVLHLNRGDGTFAEIAGYAGLEASDWTWSAVLLDVDLDGYEDLLCSTGHMFDTQDLDAEARIQAKGPWRRDLIPQKLLLFPKMQQAKVAFRNRGDLTFEESGKSWQFDQTGVGHGMALGDLDRDGDFDVVVNNLNGAAGVYRNDSSAPRVAVRLRGLPPNTRGIGARFIVSGGAVEQSQEMIVGGRYLSGDDAMRVFAAGGLTNDLRIEVRWRSGRRSVVEHARANRLYEVDESGRVSGVGTSERPSVKASANRSSRITNHESRIPFPPSNAPTLFEDLTELLHHTHTDESFDDFARQPLLPRKLSQLGPSVAWFDLNGDGWDDLIIGDGRGGQMAVLTNDARGGFARVQDAPLNQRVTRDQTGVVGWQSAPGQATVLAGSANYEDGLPNGGIVRQFDLRAKQVVDLAPGQASSAGPLAMADLDGDGDLDLFVGGRSIAGRWPEPGSSFLFRNQGGHFELDSEKSAAFSRIGLVSGAVFTDLDGDGATELVLACEWGPLRVFRNEAGSFKPWDWPVTVSSGLPTLNPQPSTLNTTLNHLTGWWTGVTAGDFDGDGRLDLAASNWGLNSPYQSAHEARQVLPAGSPQARSNTDAVNPVLLFYGSFGGAGAIDILEARFEPSLRKEVPTRPLNAFAQSLPSVRERFPTFAAFSTASVSEMVGEAWRRTTPLRAAWMASTIFLNRGDHFEMALLPLEAQFAPAFGVCVADFDGDGNEDVVLTQNFFAVQPTASRLDAGRGLLLRGDGHGGFSALPGEQSGLMIYGEGRGAAVADYDGDGRVDLVVAQNGAATKLYRNTRATPGVRVRLHGPPGNPHGVGASIRLIARESQGPVREIHAGSGYWSQDSAISVLTKKGETAKPWVRWPGGKTVEADVPFGAKEVSLSTGASLRVLK